MKDAFCNTMWTILGVLALCGIYAVQCVRIEPVKSPITLGAGSTLRVNCSSSRGVKWTADDNNMPSKAVINATVVGNDNISTLTIPNVEKADAKTYRCTDTSGTGEGEFELIVFEVEKQEVEYEYLKDVLLGCSVIDDARNYSYSWKKGNKRVTEIKVEGKQEYVEHKNGSLEIRHPPRGFAGLYTCLAEYDESGNKNTIEVEVNYFATPKVIPFEKSKNLVQDEPLVIECRVLGYPKPYITWFKDGEEIKELEGRYTLDSAKTYNGENMENAKLELKAVDFDDGGTYVCMARNDRWPTFNSTQEVLVRVKDKLAALWPFLGIVAEVVILCTIIFIYEKKRNKDAVEDEEPNQDGATPEKKEGVRHRGSANNPRA